MATIYLQRRQQTSNMIRDALPAISRTSAIIRQALPLILALVVDVHAEVVLSVSSPGLCFEP